MMDLATNTRTIGKLLGYPECCTEYFIQRITAYEKGTRVVHPKRKLNGTGFIPCDLCNETKTVEELTEFINNNRQLGSSFPNERDPYKTLGLLKETTQ